MEIILAMPALDRAQELMVALTMQGVNVRALCGTGAELTGHVAREPVDGVVLVEDLPDGSADLHLRRLLTLPGERPVAAVLAYRTEGRDALREQLRRTYGLATEIVMAGTRRGTDLASELSNVLDQLQRTVRNQERAAHERLSQPVADGAVPRAMLTHGIRAFVGVSGGVGTSTLVANLAAVAARAGFRVLLVDVQLSTGASLLYHLGARYLDGPEAPGIHQLRHDFEAHRGGAATAAADRAREVTIAVSMSGIRHPPIRVLQVPQEPQNRASISPDLILWATQVLIDSREYDAVLMDCGTGLGDPRGQHLLRAAADVFLVAMNRGAAINTLLKAAAMAGGLELQGLPHLLLRMQAGSVYTERYVHRVTRIMVAGAFPQERLLDEREGQQHEQPPLTVTNPDLPYARAVESLALKLGLTDQVYMQPEPRRRARGILGLWGRA